MITYTGIHVTREFGSPSIRDMAVQGMRLCRFAGAYEKHFWPVGMHSLLVADLLPENLEHHGLLHDVISEVVMCDIPRPMKTAEQKILERTLMARGYRALGLALPTPAEDELIHEADMKAVNAEGSQGCGPRGYRDTQTNFSLDATALDRLHYYLHEIGNDVAFLNPNNYWPLFFESRLRSSIRRAQSEVNYHQAA